MVRERPEHHLQHTERRLFHGLLRLRGPVRAQAEAYEAFNRWNDEVRERVPAGKLLVYEVKEGWEPLCDFLGVEVPEGEPFPHLNDAEAFRKMIRRRRTLASAVLGAALIGLALLYLLARPCDNRRLS